MQITKSRCPEELRLDFLPKQFGKAFIAFENSLYYWAEQLMDGYSGGFWEFYELSNGGCLIQLLEDEPILVRSPNGDEYEISSEAASIVVNLFTLSNLTAVLEEGSSELEKAINAYHWLREFSYDHPEAHQIFALID